MAAAEAYMEEKTSIKSLPDEQKI